MQSQRDSCKNKHIYLDSYSNDTIMTCQSVILFKYINSKFNVNNPSQSYNPDFNPHNPPYIFPAFNMVILGFTTYPSYVTKKFILFLMDSLIKIELL